MDAKSKNSLKKRKSSRKRQALKGRPIGPNQPREAAIAAGLRYVLEQSQGMTRGRKGSTFSYYDPSERLVRDPSEADSEIAQHLHELKPEEEP